MRRMQLPITGPLVAALTVACLTSASAHAALIDLNFDFKLNQGPQDLNFATLRLEDFNGGTRFTLTTDVSGGQGNPGIVELLFGCNGCGSPSFDDAAVVADGVQSGYDFDFRVTLNPEVTSSNSATFVASGASPLSFLESTQGSGPDAFAIIQLTGGMQTIGGVNIESGFYAASEIANPPVLIPEPSTYAMMLAGLGLVGLAFRRRSMR